MNEELRIRPHGRRLVIGPGQALSPKLADIAECSPDDAVLRLESNRQGLNEEQVETRQDEYGANEVSA